MQQQSIIIYKYKLTFTEKNIWNEKRLITVRKRATSTLWLFKFAEKVPENSTCKRSSIIELNFIIFSSSNRFVY